MDVLITSGMTIAQGRKLYYKDMPAYSDDKERGATYGTMPPTSVGGS